MKSILKHIKHGNFRLVSCIKSMKENISDLKLFNGIYHETSKQKLEQANIFNILFAIHKDCPVPVRSKYSNTIENNKKK